MIGSGTQALLFIVNALFSLYLLVLLLRFWLQVVRADFRNPLAQGILKLTSPVVLPFRRFIPAVGKIDTSTLVAALLVQCVAVLVLTLIRYQMAPGFIPILLTSVVKLVVLSLNLFAFAILIRVILSWVSPGAYNPGTALVGSLTEPLLSRIRAFIPPLGGLDLSPIFAMIGLTALGIFLQGFQTLLV